VEILERTQDVVTVRLSVRELLLLNNALNEVCNGLDLREFETRMGASPDEVQTLLGVVGIAINESRDGDL
jgi:hypothetical protein